MATEWYNVKARIKWAKVYEPDEYAGSRRWMVNVYPFDGKEWEKVQKSGIQTQVKSDKEGDKYIVLRRGTTKVIKDDLVIFCPPELTGAVNVSYTNPEGEKIRSYNKGDFKGDITVKGERVPIGNDTVAIVNFCTYDTKQGKGHRLESLKILDLVQIEKQEDAEPQDNEEIKVDEAPEIGKVEGDAIPF